MHRLKYTWYIRRKYVGKLQHKIPFMILLPSRRNRYQKHLPKFLFFLFRTQECFIKSCWEKYRIQKFQSVNIRIIPLIATPVCIWSRSIYSILRNSLFVSGTVHICRIYRIVREGEPRVTVRVVRILSPVFVSQMQLSASRLRAIYDYWSDLRTWQLCLQWACW